MSPPRGRPQGHLRGGSHPPSPSGTGLGSRSRMATKEAHGRRRGPGAPHPPRPCAGDWGPRGATWGPAQASEDPRAEPPAAPGTRTPQPSRPATRGPRRAVRGVSEGTGRAARGVGRRPRWAPAAAAHRGPSGRSPRAGTGCPPALSPAEPPRAPVLVVGNRRHRARSAGRAGSLPHQPPPLRSAWNLLRGQGKMSRRATAQAPGLSCRPPPPRCPRPAAQSGSEEKGGGGGEEKWGE